MAPARLALKIPRFGGNDLFREMESAGNRCPITSTRGWC